ncbi:DUF721 domain-containing protein [Desulfonatronovibrio magnus]|uniref:DUF721 domain-containing protein n=1 Tax=Desulfonatronovibrio magnus TaxID=698827 RepID=UPI00069619E1|nr:DUF721 domain-containing protein [Desulfonatronovibrio magnus]
MQNARQPINRWLDRLDPDGSRYLFNGICSQWEQIVGPEVAQMVSPLARKNKTLILGAEDNFVLQEFTFMSQEIVDRVNEFCGSVFFDKAHVELLKGRTPLDQIQVLKPAVKTKAKKPPNLGKLGDTVPSDSPVWRVYRQYVDFFNKKA